ncbi:retropepsin-like aspartic protease [Ascidiimonas aurantiaca]|uniref:retropepsin-like aspartic protease n=1 Tax=Ascidiimonas aurantiaca TaxID=1685432 RepID=UPI0030EE82CF
MRSTRLFYILIVPLLLSNCSYMANVRLLSNGELRKQEFVEVIPFELRKDIIVIKAYVNDDPTEKEFIFDTGAFNSKLENNLAETLGLPTVTTKKNSTAQGVTRDIEVTRIDSIRLGNTSFYNIGAGKVVYDKTSASPCVAAHGIIGANLIKLAHWKIDYQNEQIYFSDTPFPKVPNRTAYSIPFEKPTLSGTPKITLEIEGRTVENILFDVGYNGGLVLPDKFKKAFSSKNERIVFDRSTSGIYGSNRDTLTIKDLEVSIGGYSQNMPVEFSAIGKALLGNEFLKSCIVLIDYDQQEITLQPFKEIHIERAKAFIPGILNDSLWVVNRTSPSFPLKIGDTLKAVNGYMPKDLFHSHCDYIMNISSLISKDTLAVKTVSDKMVTLVVQ